MLVEINLLPKKEPKNYMFFIIISFFAIVFTSIAVFFYVTYGSYKQEVQSLEQQIQTTQEIALIEQQKANDREKNNSAKQLKDLIQWSLDYPIKTVPLLDHIVSLLPKRGFFMEFAYVKEGAVMASVQFDTSREASAYLNELNKSPWIREAKLISLITGEINILSNDGDTSGVDGVPENEVINNENNSGIPENEKNESEDKKNQIIVQNDEYLNSNDLLSKESKGKLDNEPYVPRYLGTYEIILNMNYINEMEEKDKEKTEQISPSSKEGDGEQ